MSLTKYLIDSDVARCMCCYELIEDLATALGVGLEDFFVLSQLKYQLHLANPDKALKKLGSEEAVAQANRLVEEASEVVVMADSANYLLLEGTPDIDGGELALFAALCENPSTGLVTGDKRALIALCKVTGSMEGKFTWAQILCLEEAMALLVAHFGLAHVSDKVRRRAGANIAIELIFGKSQPAELADVNEGFKSYLTHLVSETQGKYVSLHLENARS
jgi:hypothetical protein